MTYEIKKLNWTGDEPKREFDALHANTPFGDYCVRVTEDGFRWDYCFDEYYDEAQEDCESIEDGKTKAFNHWRGRLELCLIKSE